MSALSTTPRRLFALGLLVALVTAGVLSHYASTSPDGLEKVAADKGLDRAEREHELKGSPLGDYGVEGINDPRLSGGVAGVAGVLLTLAAGGALFWVVRRRDTGSGADHPAGTTAAGTAATGIPTTDRATTGGTSATALSTEEG